MEKDWVCIYRNSFLPKVELLKQKLEKNDIEVVMLNKKDSSYQNFGEVELYVHRSMVIKAQHLLSNE